MCSDVGMAISSAQRVLQPGNEGTLQREQNRGAESLKDKDFNERKKKKWIFRSNGKMVKADKENC